MWWLADLHASSAVAGLIRLWVVFWIWFGGCTAHVGVQVRRIENREGFAEFGICFGYEPF